jgi:hypothetical protein
MAQDAHRNTIAAGQNVCRTTGRDGRCKGLSILGENDDLPDFGDLAERPDDLCDHRLSADRDKRLPRLPKMRGQRINAGALPCQNNGRP